MCSVDTSLTNNDEPIKEDEIKNTATQIVCFDEPMVDTREDLDIPDNSVVQGEASQETFVFKAPRPVNSFVIFKYF